jgi:hypothetical protein
MANNFETLTVADSSVGMTASTMLIGQANYAFITVETGPIRFRIDGTAPTSSVGHPAAVGDTIELWDGEIAAFRAIRSTGTSASLSISTGRRAYGAN